MAKKSWLAVAVCAAAVAGFSANAAFAGEVTGNCNNAPNAESDDNCKVDQNSNAASICSFSGQNDGNPPPGRTAENVQNWGQIPKEVRDDIATEGFHPGDACNGHTGFLAGG